MVQRAARDLGLDGFSRLRYTREEAEGIASPEARRAVARWVRKLLISGSAISSGWRFLRS